jgi:sec-independent protein translocase protein TatA
MGRIGFPELALIVLILMVIFGANRLPEIGRGIGKAIKNFKEAGKDCTHGAFPLLELAGDRATACIHHEDCAADARREPVIVNA